MNHKEDRRRQLGYAGVQMSKVRCNLQGMGRGIRDREGERLGTSSSRVVKGVRLRVAKAALRKPGLG